MLDGQSVSLYRIVYNDGVKGAPLTWGQTLDLIWRRLHGSDSLRARGVLPVRVEKAS